MANGSFQDVGDVNRAGGVVDVVGTPPLVQTTVEAYRGRMLNTCTSNYIHGTHCRNKYVFLVEINGFPLHTLLVLVSDDESYNNILSLII